VAKRSKSGRQWFKNLAIIVPIIVALIGAIAALGVPVIQIIIQNWHHEGPDTIEVIITSPVNNSEITGDSFQIEGHLNKELDAGQFLYAVIEDKAALWWPERVYPIYSAASNSYEYRSTLWIKKPSEKRETFTIQVIIADSVIHDQFQQWRSNCLAANDWPGIPVDKVNEWGEWKFCAKVTIVH